MTLDEPPKRSELEPSPPPNPLHRLFKDGEHTEAASSAPGTWQALGLETIITEGAPGRVPERTVRMDRGSTSRAGQCPPEPALGGPRAVRSTD